MSLLAKTMLENFDVLVTPVRREFVIFEIPIQSKQSVSFGRGHAFTSSKKRKYVKELEENIKKNYKKSKMNGDIRVTILYSFPWTKDTIFYSTMHWVLMGKEPDVDNLYKPIADSMQGTCFTKDSEVCELRVRKIRSNFYGIAIMLEQIIVDRAKSENLLASIDSLC